MEWIAGKVGMQADFMIRVTTIIPPQVEDQVGDPGIAVDRCKTLFQEMPEHPVASPVVIEEATGDRNELGLGRRAAAERKHQQLVLRSQQPAMVTRFHQIDVGSKPFIVTDRDGLAKILNRLCCDEAVVFGKVRFAVEIEQRLQRLLLNCAAVRGHRMKLGQSLPQSPAHRPARDSQKIPGEWIHSERSI